VILKLTVPPRLMEK